MLKETKRKTFKFYRSYFDMFNELEKDKDKLAFIEAVLNKQFLGQDPDLSGIVKFAYISQLHSIEKQVKGWQDATGQQLTGAYIDPLEGYTQDPKQEEQVKEKEEEQVKEKGFISFWSKYPKKVAKGKCKDKFLKLKPIEIDVILKTIDSYVAYKPFKDYTHPNPMTYLNQRRWEDEIPEPKKKKKTWSVANHLKSLENDTQG